MTTTNKIIGVGAQHLVRETGTVVPVEYQELAAARQSAYAPEVREVGTYEAPVSVGDAELALLAEAEDDVDESDVDEAEVAKAAPKPGLQFHRRQRPVR